MAPMTAAERWESGGPCVDEDTRPWGHVTASANTFWTVEDDAVELVESELRRGAVRLRARGPLLEGLPVERSERRAVHTRSMSERLDAAEARRRLDAGDVRSPGRLVGDAWCPDGVPRGMHPKVSAVLASERFGISGRVRRTTLSEEPHSTIINGESRVFLYPDRYPYTAVCKLYISYLPEGSSSWVQTGEATGYLIGESTMMTSGHVQPPDGRPWRIKVVPACWAEQSVFGAGLVTYVSETSSWNSDAGSDIQVCHLYDPTGKRLGYFGYRGYDSDWEDLQVWTMAGFPYDRSLTSMSAQFDIAVRDDDGDDIDLDGDSYDTTQVESDADEASGASGPRCSPGGTGAPTQSVCTTGSSGTAQSPARRSTPAPPAEMASPRLPTGRAGCGAEGRAHLGPATTGLGVGLRPLGATQVPAAAARRAVPAPRRALRSRIKGPMRSAKSDFICHRHARICAGGPGGRDQRFQGGVEMDTRLVDLFFCAAHSVRELEMGGGIFLNAGLKTLGPRRRRDGQRVNGVHDARGCGGGREPEHRGILALDRGPHLLVLDDRLLAGLVDRSEPSGVAAACGARSGQGRSGAARRGHTGGGFRRGLTGGGLEYPGVARPPTAR
jgi:hypothetical protein